MDYKIKSTAQKAYADAITMMEDLLTNVAYPVFKQQKIDFDVDSTLSGFDALLQYSMMQIALNDDNLHIEELKLISSLSKYCNFCDYLNQRGYKNITWQRLYNADEGELQSIILDLEYDMRVLNGDLITIFPLIDKAIPERDFISELKTVVAVMLITVAAADNDYDENELGGTLIMETLNIMERKKESLPDTNIQSKQSQKHSLKDFYVKKN